MQGVVTAEVSRSVRDTEGVKAGEYIGFVGKEIITAKETRFDAACATIEGLDFSKYDFCILIRGKETTEDEAKEIERFITEKYSGKEVYIIDGMQEIYDYILILE